MMPRRPVRLWLSVIALGMGLQACGAGNSARVTAGDQPEAVPVEPEPPAPPHGITLSSGQIQRVNEKRTLVPDQLTLNPPPDDSVIEADVHKIEGQANHIPENLAGIPPSVFSGTLVREIRDSGASADESAQLVVALEFKDVLSTPVGVPAYVEAKSEPIPSNVVAVYDAKTGDELGVWTYGCGESC
jgi:hypothetical protein